MARGTNLKYKELVNRHPLEKMSHIYTEISSYSFHHRGKNYNGSPFSMGILTLDKPLYMIKEPHKHDFDQFIMFMGAETLHPEVFEAEIEFCLGPEMETHYITSPTIVHIPKGFIHCPLNFKIINKPIFFIDTMLTPEYVRNIVKEENK
jgi:hypothetical protein